MIYTAPKVGEIVVVPLVHPNGAYIRTNDNLKIPVLAKVRSTYAEMANVINFFGYIYNVPFSHIEKVNYDVDTKFYVDMINNAQSVMQNFGYKILDNSSFYETGPNINASSFLPALPGYKSNVMNPFEQPIIININEKRKKGQIEEQEQEEEYEDVGGSIRVMDVNKENLLHVITKVNGIIMFDKESSELNIDGYGTFLINDKHTYTSKDSSKEYTIFKSQRNYIHVKKSKVKYGSSKKVSKSENVKYTIRTIKLKKQETSHKKYFDIIKIINNEFD
jgi:hypothetical protein